MEKLLKQYDKRCERYIIFCKKIDDLISELLKSYGFEVHKIESRIKTKDSLRKKLLRDEGKYQKIEEITDIAGLRIITYFQDEVDRIAEMIVTEFDIDQDNSIDKRKLLDPDRFGYMSLHYVAKLSPARLIFPEYKLFANCSIEIQIRTILQHAWAEIEHDLGYKSKEAVPKEIIRRFTRLAGILELADNEFKQIRDDLLKYAESIPEKIVERPENVSIDKISLHSFINNNTVLRDLNTYISTLVEAKLIEDVHLEETISKLNFVGLKTIADLEKALIENSNRICKFAKLWFDTNKKYGSLYNSIALFYLCYVLISQHGSKDKALEYLSSSNIGPSNEQEQIAEELISTYTKVISS